MSFDELIAIQALLNPTVKEIFKLILDFRILSRNEIKAKEQSLPKEDLENALEELEQAGLIEKRSASIEAFDKFYPTGLGLTAEKMVK